MSRIDGQLLAVAFELDPQLSQSCQFLFQLGAGQLLLLVYRPSNMLVYLRDESAQIILRAATLR